MLFSVLIPAYKNTFLKECIESVLSQVFTDFELIIVDDHSPENLKDIVEKFSDKRIKFYRNSENCGAVNVVYNWNKSLDYALGEYVICMGDDDMLMPECLLEYARYIKEYPDIDIFHCRSYIINEDGVKTSLTPSWSKHESVWDNIWHRVNDYREHFIGDYLYKRESLIRNGKFYYLPMAWASDDISSYIAMREQGVIHIDTPLFCYRKNSRTLSNIGNVEIKLKAMDEEEKWYERFMSASEPEQEMDRVLFNSIKKELPHFFKMKRLNTIAYFGYNMGIVEGFLYWLRKRKQTKLSKKELIYATILAAKDRIAHKK